MGLFIIYKLNPASDFSLYLACNNVVYLRDIVTVSENAFLKSKNTLAVPVVLLELIDVN